MNRLIGLLSETGAEGPLAYNGGARTTYSGYVDLKKLTAHVKAAG